MPKNESLHSSIAAAWILLGREILPDWPCWPKTVAEALALTGSGKTQAYEVVGRLRAAVSGLDDP